MKVSEAFDLEHRLNEHELRMEIISLRQLIEKAETRSRDVVSGQAYLAVKGECDRYRDALSEIGQTDTRVGGVGRFGTIARRALELK